MLIGLFQTLAENVKLIVIPFIPDDAFPGVPLIWLAIDARCERGTFAIDTDTAHNGGCAVGFYFIPVDVE
jgi:hypothetical protein